MATDFQPKSKYNFMMLYFWSFWAKVSFNQAARRRVKTLHPTAWRHFDHRPGGVLLALWLVVLLAFGGHFCPMPAQAGPEPASTFHLGCHDSTNSPDHHVTPVTQDCQDSVCLHALGHANAADWLGVSTNSADDSPQPLLVATLLSPDWRGVSSPLPLLTTATGPLPPQRSRVLRL